MENFKLFLIFFLWKLSVSRNQNPPFPQPRATHTSNPKMRLYQSLHSTGHMQRTHSMALIQQPFTIEFSFKTSLELETHVLRNSRKRELIHLYKIHIDVIISNSGFTSTISLQYIVQI